MELMSIECDAGYLPDNVIKLYIIPLTLKRATVEFLAGSSQQNCLPNRW